MKFAQHIGIRFMVLEKNPDYKNDLIAPGILAGTACALFVLALDSLLAEPAWSLYALARTMSPFYDFWALLLCIVNQEVLFSLCGIGGIAVMLHKMWGSLSINARMHLSIIGASLLFSLIHIPLFITATIPHITLVVIRILLLTGLGGLTFGYLFWKKSFETAVCAHIVVDFIVFVAVPLYASMVP